MADTDKAVVVVSTAEELKTLLSPSTSSSSEGDNEAHEPVTTEHEVTIAGQRVPYTATCGTIEVSVDDPEKPRERLFYVAYVRTDVENMSRRPLTFCFNGGPGSSSVWLHMGCFGPRRVRIDADQLPRPPARAEDHARSILDVTDLVFVDPVGTGFSKPSHGKGEAYLKVQGDIESVGEFIRQYVTLHSRWESPKYLAGESYGTTRAAGIASWLQGRHGMQFNGLVLLSVALQFQCFVWRPGNDLPFVLFLPSYAATAAYHGVVQVEDLDAFIAEAEAFALDRYAPALLRGDRLSEEETQAIAQELSRFTGLSTDYLRKCNLRVRLDRFNKELLRDRRTITGRLDSRFTGHEVDAAGGDVNIDPAMTPLLSAFASGFFHDLRTRLKVENQEVYELLNFNVNRQWEYGDANSYLDVTEHLRSAMTLNPYLKVFAASGMYDLATPPFATDYTLAHLNLEPKFRGAITHAVYPAGHMMYIHEASMDALRADLLAFYEGSQA